MTFESMQIVYFGVFAVVCISIACFVFLGIIDQKTSLRVNISFATMLLCTICSVILNGRLNETNTSFCEITAISIVQSDVECQYLLTDTNGTEYLVDEDKVIVELADETIDTAEISTYKLLSKDDSEIIESVILSVGVAEE